jgi:hypothetical protein
MSDLILQPDVLCICRLDPADPVPAWATESSFVSITQTPEELSIVCAQVVVPDMVHCVGDWRCLRVAGQLDFSLVGVLASVVTPLAAAGISVFAISTFDTDYLLVRAGQLEEALAVLEAHGHSIRR